MHKSAQLQLFLTTTGWLCGDYSVWPIIPLTLLIGVLLLIAAAVVDVVGVLLYVS